MRARFPVLVSLLAVGLWACSDQRSPTAPADGPLAAISDGAHMVGEVGNPDFFFLPPLVPDPSGNSNFDPGKFTSHLRPVVRVFALPPLGTDARPDECYFPAPNAPVFGPVLGVVDVAQEMYKVNWNTPPDLAGTYRVCVFSSSAGTLLGFLDVAPVPNGMKNARTGETFYFQDGRTLPIKFRIESGALCPPTYTVGCAKTTVAPVAGVADTIILPSGNAALVIPAGAVAPGDVVDIEAKEQLPPYDGMCLPPSLLGQSNGCYSFSAVDANTQRPYAFVSPVKVEICVAIPDAFTQAQADQLRLFKYNGTDGVQQWPWAEPTEIDCTGYSPLQPTGGGLGAAALRTLGQWAARLLAPQPVYAASFGIPPKGIGGSGGGFSDFGGGLLSSLAPYHWTDNPQLPAGATVYDSVMVRDTAGNPVSGVHVTFTVGTGGGKVAATAQDVPADSVIITTDASGLAGSVWTLGTSTGTNTLTASAYAFVGSPVTFTATATIAIPAECSGVTEIPAAECAALVALYSSTGGPSWLNSSGWLQTNTPCSWFGVTCAGGRVQSVILNGNQLSGGIPAELTQLSALETLNLDSAQLSGGIPAAVGTLSRLRTLSLSWASLTGPLPASLGGLTSLVTLRLEWNQLTGGIPTSLGGLAALEELSLTGNQLSGAIPPELSGLHALRYLLLGNNQLSGTIPSALGTLANLRYLMLSWNQLNGAIPSSLGSLGQLANLSLEGNSLSGAIPPEIGNLGSLEWLGLYHNQLSGTIPTDLGKLTALTALDLRENQLSGTIPGELGALTMLDQFYLSANQLNGTIPVTLGNLTRLRAFMVEGNQLTGPIPAALGNLTRLEAFRLESNQLSGLVPLEVAVVGGKIYSGNCTFTPGNADLYVPDTPAYRNADIHGYGTICGLPFTPVPAVQVDGTMSSGEWDQADHYTGTITLPDNSTTTIDVYMTNDATNLYMAVRFNTDVSAWGSNIGFTIDENRNGTYDGTEDAWVGQDRVAPDPDNFGDLFYYGPLHQGQLDNEPGQPYGTGTVDGGMAVGGGGGAGTVVEMWHPLHSNDTGHDMQMSSGMSFGFWFVANLPQFPVTKDNFLPASGTWTYAVR